MERRPRYIQLPLIYNDDIQWSLSTLCLIILLISAVFFLVLSISGLGIEHTTLVYNTEEVGAWSPSQTWLRSLSSFSFCSLHLVVSASDIFLSLCLIMKYYFDVHISKGHSLTIIKMVLIMQILKFMPQPRKISHQALECQGNCLQRIWLSPLSFKVL